MASQDLELLGTIVRLQVQHSSLKVGSHPYRVYDPSGITSVSSAVFDGCGVVGLGEANTRVADVHHRDHPATKNDAGSNDISVLFTSHYRAMRKRFGNHLPDGIAGESVLVETERMVTEDDLSGGVVVVSRSGRPLHLANVVAAEPCVEFTRFVLQRPQEFGPDRDVASALSELRGGMRGFYCSYSGKPVMVGLGDRVYRGL